MKQPYTIHVDSFVLDDLCHRLARTRWTNDISNDNWETGTNLKYLKELCDYWSHGFNWKKNEAFLNSFSHFTTTIDGMGIHFIHEKGKGEKRIPLLLIHGFPDSFVRFLKLIPLLTAPDENGFSFDLIIPSIPGYGFSEIPTEPGMDLVRIASLFAKLVTEELGYSNFIVHGGDWGSGIAEQIAVNHPEYLLGVHLLDIPWYHLFSITPENMTDAEKKYMQAGQQWSQKEAAYAMIQSTKPQTLGYALNDSPAGLASWIIEKFYLWSDCKGNLENCYTKDELLTNLTIYWATQTINSAIRLYYEVAVAMQQAAKEKEIRRVEIPTAAAIFPLDLIAAPREFAERIFNIQQWTEMPEGGHFAAMEQPVLLADDIRKFGKRFSSVKASNKRNRTVNA